MLSLLRFSTNSCLKGLSTVTIIKSAVISNATTASKKAGTLPQLTFFEVQITQRNKVAKIQEEKEITCRSGDQISPSCHISPADKVIHAFVLPHVTLLSLEPQDLF